MKFSKQYVASLWSATTTVLHAFVIEKAGLDTGATNVPLFVGPYHGPYQEKCQKAIEEKLAALQEEYPDRQFQVSEKAPESSPDVFWFAPKLVCDVETGQRPDYSDDLDWKMADWTPIGSMKYNQMDLATGQVSVKDVILDEETGLPVYPTDLVQQDEEVSIEEKQSGRGWFGKYGNNYSADFCWFKRDEHGVDQILMVSRSWRPTQVLFPGGPLNLIKEEDGTVAYEDTQDAAIRILAEKVFDLPAQEKVAFIEEMKQKTEENYFERTFTGILQKASWNTKHSWGHTTAYAFAFGSLEGQLEFERWEASQGGNGAVEPNWYPVKSLLDETFEGKWISPTHRQILELSYEKYLTDMYPE